MKGRACKKTCSCEVWINRRRRTWEVVSRYGTVAVGRLTTRGLIPERAVVEAHRYGCGRKLKRVEEG